MKIRHNCCWMTHFITNAHSRSEYSPDFKAASGWPWPRASEPAGLPEGERTSLGQAEEKGVSQNLPSLLLCCFLGASHFSQVIAKGANDKVPHHVITAFKHPSIFWLKKTPLSMAYYLLIVAYRMWWSFFVICLVFCLFSYCATELRTNHVFCCQVPTFLGYTPSQAYTETHLLPISQHTDNLTESSLSSKRWAAKTKTKTGIFAVFRP